jgi:hypothetical protein
MEMLAESKDQDNYTETEDEFVSFLHMDKRPGLNRLMKRLSLDYQSLLDYVYRDVLPEEADDISCNAESERREDD